MGTWGWLVGVEAGRQLQGYEMVVRDGSALDGGGTDGDGDKWWNTVYILKIKVHPTC